MTERTLTDEDLKLIGVATADAFNAAHHRSCLLNLNPQVAEALNNLTPEQIGILRRTIDLAGKASMIVGGLVLTAVASAVILIFTKGFWVSLAKGIKDGGNP